MEVQSGWSTEFARQRGSVTADETDLLRILAEAGIGSALAGVITTQDAFLLLDAEAQRLAAFMLVEAEPTAEHKAAVREWAEKLAERAAMVKDKYGS